MTTKPTTPHVYTAIRKAMSLIAKEGISKDRSNDQQGYKFRGIDDVYNALAPVLSEAGLCILPFVKNRHVTERQTQRGGTLFYVTVEMDFTLVSAEDGSSHVICVHGEAMDSGDKATNKAMSAAYKYACMQAFCIPTEGDNDADQTTHNVAPRAPAPAPVEAKLVSAVEIDVITKLADASFTPLDKIAGAYGVNKLEELPLSVTADVISRLQKKIADLSKKD